MENKGRGVRLKMAQFLNCKTAFVSQVLNQYVNFSMEQTVSLNIFFNHNKDESRYFVLLVQLERAGSEELRKFLLSEISEIHSKRKDLKERMNIKDNLDENNQHIYYSTWYYAAIHILLSVPKYQTPELIAEYLRLPIETVNDALGFLCSTGLAVQVENKYMSGKTSIFLSSKSIQMQRHLSNWRHQANVVIDRGLGPNLHYSSVISLSEEDIPKVKELMLACVEDCRKITRESREEKVRVMNLDFFEP